ncbi:hypothetical protein ABZ815_05565 [Nonomuraea sp. NPDC047529]|uniref:hypothetical protein n=1 Tax=Nonomuraea sp. NPDC047529 TaxID=3155623 RepID=UPI0033C8B6F2
MPLLNFWDVAIETSLRPGVLYRSAQPHTLPPEGARLVADLRLIADLGELAVAAALAPLVGLLRDVRQPGAPSSQPEVSPAPI